MAAEQKNKKSAEESAAENGGKKASGGEPKRKPGKKRKTAGGGKNKYERFVRYKLTLIESKKRMGWSDEEIAKYLGIAYSTFKIYKGKYEELSAALRAGADEACAEVENALFRRAVGVTKIIKKPIKVREVLYDNGKRTKETERIEYAEEEVYFPPDVSADVFYLTHRDKEHWGKDAGGPDDTETGVIIIPEADK